MAPSDCRVMQSIPVVEANKSTARVNSWMQQLSFRKPIVVSQSRVVHVDALKQLITVTRKDAVCQRIKVYEACLLCSQCHLDNQTQLLVMGMAGRDRGACCL